MSDFDTVVGRVRDAIATVRELEDQLGAVRTALEGANAELADARAAMTTAYPEIVGAAAVETQSVVGVDDPDGPMPDFGPDGPPMGSLQFRERS